jgi:dienelactone hydrolase
MPLKSRVVRSFALVLFILTSRVLAGAADRGFVDRVLRDDRGEHKYVVFVPHDYAPEKEWPVILFLHTAADRGTDGRAPVETGLGPAIRAREQSFPFIAVFPQCEDRDASARGGWLPDTADAKRALAILDEVERSYRTDKDRVFLTGISMGGFGAWAIAAADPDRWAAVVPISGGSDPDTAAKLTNLPIWCFHGAADRIVPADESRRMVAAVEQAGGKSLFTEFEATGHNVWDAAYGSRELFTWLLAQKRGTGVRTATSADMAAMTGIGVKPAVAPIEAPFVPALEIPNAVFVRLGNEMLAALADSIPQVIPPDALAGTLPDVQQNTSAEGMAITVQLRGLSYRGRVTRAVIEPRAENRIAITLAMRDVNIVINRTNISGEISASAGPIRIVLGHRADLPIAFDVEPVIEERRLRLKLHGTRFRLPRDNWTVGYPQWVNASGGMFVTDERVGSGLRNGLYNDPGRIEREVIAAVPRMLEQLEDQFSFEPVNRIVANLWPLPVYEPRVRAWPEAVHVDDGGATVALGISVAAYGPRSAPDQPRRVTLSDSNSVRSVGGEQFRFGLATGLMEPIATQVVADDAARAHVSDMPMKKLQPLGDAATLREIAPDLKRHGDARVRAVFRLAGPLRLGRGDGDAADAIVFEMSKVVCSISVQEPKSNEWTPFLEIEASLRHAARPNVSPRTPSTRVLKLDWLGDAAIDATAHFAANYKPADEQIDGGRIRQILADAWHDWTQADALVKVPVEDIDLGFSKLRADSIGWDGAYLATTFTPAGFVMRNLTDQPIAYEIKGPYSDWGGPYTLEPQKDHRYPISYPVTCRFRSGATSKVYTLPAGSRFEFQSAEAGKPELYASREEPIDEAEAPPRDSNQTNSETDTKPR